MFMNVFELLTSLWTLLKKPRPAKKLFFTTFWTAQVKLKIFPCIFPLTAYIIQKNRMDRWTRSE